MTTEIPVNTFQQGHVSARWYFLAPLIAIVGGVFGIVGAVFEEILHLYLFVPFIVAPMAEEALKPSGVYLLLARWPHALSSRLYTAFLAGLGGLTFGVIESLLYIYVYIEDPSATYVIVRWSTSLSLHMIWSFIVGFGINERLLASARGEIPFLRGNKKFFVIPMIIHSLFNIGGVVIPLIWG